MKIYRYFKIPIVIISDLLKLIIMYLPGTSGIKIRRIYYKRKFKRCGDNLTIDVGVNIDGAEHITVGNNVCIDKYCIIATGKTISGNVKWKLNSHFDKSNGEITLGNDIHIAQFCILMGYGGISISNNSVLSAGSKLYSLTNIAYNPNDRSSVVSIQPYSNANSLAGAIVLESNVWLGLNCIVMPGITIETNSFAVSNSLLLSSFGMNSYIEGQPAKRVASRFTDFKAET